MRLKLCFLIILFIGAVAGVKAQDVCPIGQVCLPQATANRLLDTVNQLIAAKDLISKLTNERGASDAVIASANRIIDDYKKLDDINGMMILKYKDIIALYEKTMAMYVSLVEKLTAQINKPKTGWQKLLATLERIADIAAGIALGRVL